MPTRSRSRLPGCLGLLVTMIVASAGGAGASGLSEKFSLRVSGAVMLNLGGSYSDTRKFRDVVDLGGGLNLGLRYEISKNVYIDAGYGYNVMTIKAALKPYGFRHGSSYFDMSAATLNAALYLKSGYSIEPYFTVGGGLYPWAFRSGMFGGDIWPAPAAPQTELKNTSFGLNCGLGVEVNVFINMTALLEVRYTYLFSRDPARFATDDFTQIDFLGINLGIIYYFKRK